MNSQNSEETKTPIIPPGFEMKFDAEKEENSEERENDKSEKEESNIAENQMKQNHVKIVHVENKDKSENCESVIKRYEQQSKQSTEELEDYEKIELIDCNVGADDHESQNVMSETTEVENESNPVQAVAATETKNPETAESMESDAGNVRINKNDGGKPKIITLEEMFNETELEKVQLVDTEDSGADQQNVKSPPAVVEIKVSKADHKSVESRELDAVNVQMDESNNDKPKTVTFEEMFVPTAHQNLESMLASKNVEAKESDAVNVEKSEIYNFDRHAITVAFDVEHFEDESKTNVVTADQKQLKNEAVEIQEEEKPMSKNDSLLLGTVSMNVKTESGDEVESKVPQDEVIEEESISDVATFEMDQKVQSETAIVESKVHNESESDKNKVFADDVDAEKTEVPIQPETVKEKKDESFESDIRIHKKGGASDKAQMNENEALDEDKQLRESVVSPPIENGDSESKNVLLLQGDQQEKDESLKICDVSLENFVEDIKEEKFSIVAIDESQTNEGDEIVANEPGQIQPTKGLVKSLSKTLLNLFACGNNVTSSHEYDISDKILHDGNNESSQFFIPNISKAAAVEEEDKKDENVGACNNYGADKVHVNERNEVIQNQPIQAFNLFSCKNVDDKIERSRLQNETIVQDEPKSLSYQPGFEPEEAFENQHVQSSEAIQQQMKDDKPGNKAPVENREHVSAGLQSKSIEKQAPFQGSEALKDETDKLQQQHWNDNNDSWSDAKDNNLNIGDSASTIFANENVPTIKLPVSASEPDATENVQPTDSFNPIFDEYFLKFLETQSSNLEVTAIQNFAETIPSDFIVSEDRYPILFKVLFKIKEISNKTIFDESLTVLKKLFWNLDYNKFLVQFWSCEEFKNRENGPIGFSFTEGLATMVLTGNLPKHERDVAKINEKAVEAAWSMLLDVEATVTKMLENAFSNKAMNPFYTAVFRKLRCLGEFMIVINGKNLPIFFHFYYQLFGDSEGNKLIIGLTLLVNVCKSSNDENGSALMEPNFVLQEIMTHLICDDEKKETYMLALKRFFDQPFDLKCEMKWNSESDEFENPAVFFKTFIKYYNRKQKLIDNNVVFFIFEEFKKSLDQSQAKIEILEKLDENIEVDWPFVYKIVKLLNIQNFHHAIPESLFMILPEKDMEKFTSLTEEEPSLEKALTAIVELHFVTVDKIPDVLYKNLWSSYPASEKDCINIFASSIIQAYNNLKSTIDVKFGLQFIDFIQQICDVLLEKNVIQQFSRTFGTDFTYVKANSYMIVIVRTLRLIVEEKIENGDKLPFNSISPFFNSMINLFAVQTFDLFGKIRNDTRDKFAPWRRGNADCMADELSMAINYLLNAIQKDILFVFDQTFKHTQSFIDVLIYLCKQGSYYGVHHPRLEILLLEKLPNFYEPKGFQRNDQGQYYRNQENRRDDFGQQQSGYRGGFGNNRGGDNYTRGGYQNSDAPRGRGNSYRGFGAPEQNQNGRGNYGQRRDDNEGQARANNDYQSGGEFGHQSGDQNERASFGLQRGVSSSLSRGYSGFRGGASETSTHRGRGGDTNVSTNRGYSGFNGGASDNDLPILGHTVRGGGRGGETNVPSNREFGGDRQRGRDGPSTIRGGGYRGYTVISENAPGNSQNDRQSTESFSQVGW